MSGDTEVITFGCRLNSYESEVMKQHAAAAGFKNTVIINTCAVTAEAERQARQTIRKIRRERPEAKIIVTGCSAQIKPDSYAEMAEVNFVIGNHEKLKAETFANLGTEKLVVNDIQSVRETAGHLLAGFDGRARAFVQVQNGCDHRCTFCIIPYGRGPSRSVPIGVVVEQVQALVASGYQEIVLTGVDITSYGPDLPGQPTLGQMIRRLLAQVPQLPRLRLSSLDPVEIDDDLWQLISSEPRLMPHLHLSVQAGDDMVLKRMKRRHNRQDVIDVCARARALRPDMVFGADIIAGFPTETEAMFQNTLTLVEECELTWLHVFPYSARSGTPAAKMPQVPMPVRKERAARLRALGEKMEERLAARLHHQTVELLMETETLGRSREYAEVTVNKKMPVGVLMQARVTGFVSGGLSGQQAE